MIPLYPIRLAGVLALIILATIINPLHVHAEGIPLSIQQVSPDQVLNEMLELAAQLKPEPRQEYRDDIRMTVELAIRLARARRAKDSKRLLDQALSSMLEEIGKPNASISDLRLTRLKEITAGQREAGLLEDMAKTVNILTNLLNQAYQVPDTIALREMEIAHLQLIARDRSAALARLERARKLALKDTRLRDRAFEFRFLGILYAQAGEDEKAWQCLEEQLHSYDRMTDKEWDDYMIRYHLRVQSHAIAAVAQTLAGHTGAAKNTLAKAWSLALATPNGEAELFKEPGMRDVAWAASHVGDTQLAVKILQDPEHGAYVWRAVPHVVKGLVKTAQFDEAIDLLEKWPCAVKQIGVAQAERGNASEAIVNYESPNKRLDRLCRECQNSPGEFDDRQDFRWIAAAYVKARSREEAVRWARSLPNPDFQLTALLGIFDTITDAKPVLWWQEGSSPSSFTTGWSPETLNLVPPLKNN